MAKVRLGDIATVVTKGTTPTTMGFQFEDGGINFVKIESISEDGTFLKEKFSHISDECNVQMRRSQLQENDILFSIAGAIGRSAIVTKEILPANTNQALAIIRVPKGKIDYNYLLYALSSSAINQQATQHQQGVAQLNISLKNVSDFLLPIYTEAMQKRIVQNLKKIDKLIFLRKQQLAKLDEVVKARFVEMFGEPVSNPYKFEVRSLQNMLDDGIITYHLDGNHGSDYPRNEEFVQTGIPYISANCIVNGDIDFSLAKHLTKERAKKLRKGIAQNGDVLFAHNATVGPVSILHTDEEKVILGTSLTAYRCNKKVVLPPYLKCYMQSDGFVRQYSKDMKQTTRNQVPITVQRKYLFMIPPLSLQNEFAAFAERVDQQKRIVQQSLEKLELMKKALMQEYFG